MALTIISGWAVYKLSAVNMAPLGPSLYSFITWTLEKAYFFVVMGSTNIDERRVGQYFDSRVQVDAVHVGEGLSKFLSERVSTWVKVVLPVPDIPMTITQISLPSVLVSSRILLYNIGLDAIQCDKWF